MATIKPEIEKQKLADIELSTLIVTDIRNLPDSEGNVDITIDNEFDPYSYNPVQNRVIWNKLSRLSVEIENNAYEHDLSLGNAITKSQDFPIDGKTIYRFSEQLSTNIIKSGDNELTYDSENIVKSSGIYSALSSVSSDVLQRAFNHDLSLRYNIISDGNDPVPSKTIYNFCKKLSNDITSSIEFPAVVDKITKDGENAVKSSGIYEALSAISSEIPTNYVSTNADVCNEIESDNNFYGKIVLDKQNNGPQLIFNESEKYHFTANGLKVTIPEGDFGIGSNISEDKETTSWIEQGTTISSDIMATRRWTKANLQNKLPEFQLSTLELLADKQKTVIKFRNEEQLSIYEWVGSLTTQKLKDAGILFESDDVRVWQKQPEQIRIGTAITDIGDKAFEACTTLKNIVFHDLIDTMGFHAFYECTDLSTLILPLHLIEIGYEAFANCNKLQHLTIPYSVKYMDARIFKQCNSLTALEFENRTLDEVQHISNRQGGEINEYYPWGLDETVISTKKIVGYDVQLSSENGISGIYINDKSLYDYFDNHYLKNETSSDSELSAAFNSLSNYYQKNETSSVEELQYAFDNLDVDIDATNLVDKRYDNELSGNIGLYQHDFYNLSGNYIQSNSGNKVKNFSDRNSFLQAESETRYGNAYTGTKGYCIVGLVNDYTIKLSGDITDLYDFYHNGQLNDYDISGNFRAISSFVFGNDMSTTRNARFSISLGSQSGSMRFVIESVDKDAHTVTFKNNDLKILHMTKEDQAFRNLDEDGFIDLFLNDDNAFYCVGFPELGNVVIKNFYGQHAEGGSIRAIQKYTHAEGRDNIADVRYAHVEGSHNAAGDMASHAEGFRTLAAKRFSHAEGVCTKALADRSHVAGVGATSLSSRSWIWNGKTDGNDDDFDLYQQPVGSGNGAFCINPEKGINGFYIGDRSLGTILSEFEPAGSGENITNYISVTYLADELDYGFKYNSGKCFEDSLSVNAFINQGAADQVNQGNQWNQVDNPLTNFFSGKLIQVNPGDVLTYKLMPYSGTGRFTGYIKPLTSIANLEVFLAENRVKPESLTGTGKYAPVDTSISDDAELSSDWTYLRFPTHSLYRPEQIDQWISRSQVDKHPTKINGWELSTTEFEVSVKIPQNTHYLYVNTHFGENVSNKSAPQKFETFKLNGTELIRDKGYERSSTINAFNMNSKWNLRHRMLDVASTYGYCTRYNQNYMMTHLIPCQYGDQIVISEVNTSNVLKYVRSIEYFDENFNRIYVSSNSNTNNGFNATSLMVAPGSIRTTLALVNNIPYPNCKYVRLCIPEVDPNHVTADGKRAVKNNLSHEFPNDPTAETKNATVIQIVNLKSYPQYKISEHKIFVPFKSAYPNYQKQQLIPEFNGKKIIFFGDSITRNSITSTTSDEPTHGDSSTNKRDTVLKGYFNFVSEELQCSYVNAGDGADVAAIQEGYDQSSTRTSLVHRLSSDTGFPTNIKNSMIDADMACVLIGVNDWTYSWTPFGDIEGTDENINTFCGAIRYIQHKLDDMLGNQMPIIFMTPIKRNKLGTIEYPPTDENEWTDSNITIDYTKTNKYGKTLEDYANAIKTICSNKPRTYVIDLYHMCKFDPNDENHRNLYFPDGTHPTTIGHQIIAKCILKKLPEILKDYNYQTYNPNIESMIND